MKAEEPADGPRIEIRTGKDRSDHVQLFILKHGIRNHDEPGPFPLVKDIVGYLKMCHSILPIKR